MTLLPKIDRVYNWGIFVIDFVYVCTESSRQGVGTVHPSSNFAASHHYES